MLSTPKVLMPCRTSMDATWANPACTSLNTWLDGEGMPPAASLLGSFQPTRQPTKCKQYVCIIVCRETCCY